jgi:hypothetical protein
MVSDHPALAYYDCSGEVNAVEYVRSASSTGTGMHDWMQIVYIDSMAGMTDLSMIVVDGNPAISYFHLNESALKYARSTTSLGHSPTDWIKLTLTGDYESGGQRSSLAIVAGRPAISSRVRDLNLDIIYVSASTSAGSDVADWNQPAVVDSMAETENTPTPTSLAVVNGHPAIGYRDINSFALKYAYYMP